MTRRCRLLNRRGMHMTEWAILFGLIATAFLTIQVYVRRALQARVMNAADAFTSINATIASNGDPTLKATFINQRQAEPYYQEAFYNTYQESVEQEHLGGGKIQIEKVSDVTARGAGGSQKQKSAVNRQKVENLWKD